MEHIIPLVGSFLLDKEALSRVCLSWYRTLLSNDKDIIKGIQRKYPSQCVEASIYLALRSEDNELLIPYIQEFSSKRPVPLDDIVMFIYNERLAHSLLGFIGHNDRRILIQRFGLLYEHEAIYLLNKSLPLLDRDSGIRESIYKEVLFSGIVPSCPREDILFYYSVHNDNMLSLDPSLLYEILSSIITMTETVDGSNDIQVDVSEEMRAILRAIRSGDVRTLRVLIAAFDNRDMNMITVTMVFSLLIFFGHRDASFDILTNDLLPAEKYREITYAILSPLTGQRELRHELISFVYKNPLYRDYVKKRYPYIVLHHFAFQNDPFALNEIFRRQSPSSMYFFLNRKNVHLINKDISIVPIAFSFDDTMIITNRPSLKVMSYLDYLED